MERHQNKLFWALVITETSHVFCCVLPTVFSVLGLLTGLGLVSAMPMGLDFIHEFLHRWELPMVMTSGVILVLGWGLYLYSRKIDCHDSGCHHGPCEGIKKRTGLILKIATLLFVANVTIYGAFHYKGGFVPVEEIVAPHFDAHAH